MLKALIRTTSEILDSKKAAYSFITTAAAMVLHLKFGVSPENALLLVSPLGLATAAEAHVDAKRGSRGSPNGPTTETAGPPPSGPPAEATQDSASASNNLPQS